MEFGKGDGFRRPGLLERAGRPFRNRLTDPRLKVPLKRLYEGVLDALPGDRLVSRFPHGETVRLAGAYRQVMWNSEEYEAFRQDVPPGATVFDVGANLGAYTLLFAQWVGPAGRIHAFEPAPGARRGLERHLALNRLSDRVTVHHEAVSDGPGVARFTGDGVQGDNRLAGDGAGTIDVTTTSLDAICAAHGLTPALIKLDVEGAELAVLRGARATIAAAGDALALYMEIHPHLWASFGYGQAELEHELDRQGLRPERLDGRPDPWGLAGVCLRLRRCAS